MIDDDIKFVNNSFVVILPVTTKSPSIEDEVFTTNPSTGEIDAVAEPLAILNASPDNCDTGISNKFLPLPLNEPLNSFAITLSAVMSGTSKDSEIETLPLNSDLTEPVENTLKNPAPSIDAVTEPLKITFEISASSVSAERGISNKSLPLPLNTEPLTNLTSPSNKEPLSVDVTMN